MTGVMALQRRRGFRVGFVVGILAPALAVGGLAVVGSRPLSQPGSAGSIEASALEVERNAFIRYARSVDRVVREGGFVVTQGMRPGLADIADGRFSNDTLVTMAKGWLGSMERVRAELAAVAPPAFLTEAARRYDAALAAYVAVAEALLEGAEARGERRAMLIEQVPPLGRRADALWDRAHVELERHRARLGLSTDDRASRGGNDAGK